mmetsp:Transcript_97298/g.272301  ORF Transcript_97298/g.272301 Transcript_97298/m.272301 type:complete len:212 (-) Transcript_97298:589-1224(-)
MGKATWARRMTRETCSTCAKTSGTNALQAAGLIPVASKTPRPIASGAPPLDAPATSDAFGAKAVAKARASSGGCGSAAKPPTFTKSNCAESFRSTSAAPCASNQSVCAPSVSTSTAAAAWSGAAQVERRVSNCRLSRTLWAARRAGARRVSPSSQESSRNRALKSARSVVKGTTSSAELPIRTSAKLTSGTWTALRSCSTNSSARPLAVTA